MRLTRELKPHVIITAGPEGICGHCDHIAVHRWTTIAIAMTAGHDCLPRHISQTCKPHRVSTLYLRVLPEILLEERRTSGAAAPVMTDGVPFRFVGWPCEDITSIIDVAEYADQKLQGIRCHATQVGRESRWAEAPDEVVQDLGFAHEHCELARSTVRWPQDKQTDLFDQL